MESPQSIFSAQSPVFNEVTPRRRHRKACRVQATFTSLAEDVDFLDFPLGKAHIERSGACLELCEG